MRVLDLLVFPWLRERALESCSQIALDTALSLMLQRYWPMIISSTYHVIVLQFSYSVMSNSLQPHGLQHTRLPCPLPTLGVFSNSCPLSRSCHPTISSSVIPFSSCLQSFPASGSFQFLVSGGQSTGASVSASVLPMNIQD